MMTDRELWFNTYKLHVEQDPEQKLGYLLDGKRVFLVDWAMDLARRVVAEAPKEPVVEAPATQDQGPVENTEMLSLRKQCDILNIQRDAMVEALKLCRPVLEAVRLKQPIPPTQKAYVAMVEALTMADLADRGSSEEQR